MIYNGNRSHSRFESAMRHAISYVVSRARRASVPIVMYHGVTADPLPLYDWCQVEAGEFDEQIRGLRAAYRVLPLSEIVARLEQGKPLPPRTAAVTFDDGLRNIYTTARPILERYGVPATVFLVTGLLDNGQPPWPSVIYEALTTTTARTISIAGHSYALDTAEQKGLALDAVLRWLKDMPSNEKNLQLPRLLMTLEWQGKSISPSSPVATLRWSEVEQMNRSPLFEFGGHTHSHEILARCSERQQWLEISRCAQALRERLERVDVFAYPNGTSADFTALTKNAVRTSGFRAAVTAIRGLNHRRSDLFELRRVAVGRGAPMWQFEEQLAGL